MVDAPALMLRPEKVMLHALVRGLRPRRVLEIGTHRGGSTLIICAALDEIGAGVIACIDPNPVVEPHDWERMAHRATMIIGSSPDAIQEASEIARGRFDFVLIDGDHDVRRRAARHRGRTYGARARLACAFPRLALLADKAGNRRRLAAASSGLLDCGTLSREGAYEDRHELGHPVIWGGLRLLQFVGQAGEGSPEVEHKPSRFAPAKVIDTAEALALVDVSAHNAGASRPTFDEVASQVVSASQFSHPDFERLQRTIFPGPVTIPWGYSEATVTVPHRKVWEFVYVLRAAEQSREARAWSTRSRLRRRPGADPSGARASRADRAGHRSRCRRGGVGVVGRGRAAHVGPALLFQDLKSCRTTCLSGRLRTVMWT